MKIEEHDNLVPVDNWHGYSFYLIQVRSSGTINWQILTRL